MDERQELIEFFKEMEIMHGTVFDDGRRWCGLCLAPRFMCQPVEGNPWTERTCFQCKALWPEFMEIAAIEMMEDPDFQDGIGLAVIN